MAVTKIQEDTMSNAFNKLEDFEQQNDGNTQAGTPEAAPEKAPKQEGSMSPLSWILNFLISFGLLALGVILGFTIKVPQWPDISMPMLGCGAGILAASIFSGIFVSIKAWRDEIVRVLFYGLELVFNIGVAIFTLAQSISSAAFGFLWLLSIVVIFPVCGLAVTAVVIICVPILILTVLAVLVACIYVPLTELFHAEDSASNKPTVAATVIGIVAVCVSVFLNVFNFVYLIPEQEAAIYRITYVVPEGARTEDPTGSKYNRYYFNRGVEEKYLFVAKMDGYSFGGWYYDSECTVPFESFGRYEKKGELTLYAKMELATVTIRFDADSYDYKTNSNLNLENGIGYATLGETYLLPTLDAPEGYTFIGWSERFVNATKFAVGDYQLIDSIEITEDNISFNSVTVYALFLELPTEKLELNKPLDIRTNTDGRPITNRGYYVEGSSETEYTFIFNQGAVSNYDSKYGSDYFSARVYKADGSLITVVSSKQLGGRFTVPAYTDFYIRFGDYDNSGSQPNESDHMKAMVMLATGHHDYEALAGALEIETKYPFVVTNPTTKDVSGYNCDDYDHIGNVYLTNVKTVKYTKNDEVKEFGVLISDNDTEGMKVTIAVYKDGVFVKAYTVDYDAVKKPSNNYAKIFNTADLEDGTYYLVFSLMDSERFDSSDSVKIVAQTPVAT